MTQVSILSGIYTDGGSPDFRSSYPRNMIPVVKSQGISSGYLRPAEGIEQVGTGPGADRGAINWNGVLYRVMGTSLVSVSAAGAVTVHGDVGLGGTVTMDYSFDRLAIASGGRMYYWNGTTLTQVTDPDLGVVLDLLWIAGYFVTTDGTNLVQTDLADPASINPLHYGSAETDPDPVRAVDELRNELYGFGRYTVEVYQNGGGTGFVFQRVDGAHSLRFVQHFSLANRDDRLRVCRTINKRHLNQIDAGNGCLGHLVAARYLAANGKAFVDASLDLLDGLGIDDVRTEPRPAILLHLGLDGAAGSFGLVHLAHSAPFHVARERGLHGVGGDGFAVRIDCGRGGVAPHLDRAVVLFFDLGEVGVKFFQSHVHWSSV